MITITVPTPEGMADFGAEVARWLRAGDVVALDGELGAGKTTFTRGLGRALGVRGAVTSPTFVLARTHSRDGHQPPLVHVDAYRLSGGAELDDLDLDLAASITVVEWAGDLLRGMTDSVLAIRIYRPTGACQVGPYEPAVPAEQDGAAQQDGAAGYDDELVEPRRVQVSVRGPAWATRGGLLDALSGRFPRAGGLN